MRNNVRGFPSTFSSQLRFNHALERGEGDRWYDMFNNMSQSVTILIFEASTRDSRTCNSRDQTLSQQARTGTQDRENSVFFCWSGDHKTQASVGLAQPYPVDVQQSALADSYDHIQYTIGISNSKLQVPHEQNKQHSIVYREQHQRKVEKEGREERAL